MPLCNALQGDGGAGRLDFLFSELINTEYVIVMAMLRSG